MLAMTEVKKAFQSGLWKCRECRGDDYDSVGSEISYEQMLNTLSFGEQSIDVTLGFWMTRITPAVADGVIDPRDKCSMMFSDIGMFNGHYDIQPGECILGVTQQAFNVDASLLLGDDYRKYSQGYEGRSSVGRLFLTSHQCAGFIDYGFKGYITLELKNESQYPIRLYPGMRIGQVYFNEIEFIGSENYGERGNYSQKTCMPKAPILGEWHF